MAIKRYPDSLGPFRSELPERDRRFADLREDFLLSYSYNTARAYWGDLDDLYLWATKRGKDVLGLSQRDIRQYLTLLRRRRYSASTIRRRLTAFRSFYATAASAASTWATPTDGLTIRKERVTSEHPGKKQSDVNGVGPHSDPPVNMCANGRVASGAR